MDLSSLANVGQEPTPDEGQPDDDINAAMLAKRQKSVARRRAHASIRQSLKEGKVNLTGLLAQAAFDEDAKTIRLASLLTAIPKINTKRADEIMVAANLPKTRKLGWLAEHPSSASKFMEALDRYMEIVNPTPRELPNPNWPWRDDD